MFEPFPKIPRLFREITITEKIDGTNAQVFIVDGKDIAGTELVLQSTSYCQGFYLFVGSRKRYITPDNDNFGFATWVYSHTDELIEGLGEGRHFGEWWGQGIQRNYGLDHKRFSLFNTKRWNEENKPECCHVVPVLYEGMFNEEDILKEYEHLYVKGSYAAPGFMKPEGLMIYHKAANQMFKYTLWGDGHKGDN